MFDSLSGKFQNVFRNLRGLGKISESNVSDALRDVRLALLDAGRSIQLYDLATDIGETNNLAASQPERVAEMKALLEKLIADGRSTPGEPQKNDVAVVRFPKAGAPKAKAAKKAK